MSDVSSTSPAPEKSEKAPLRLEYLDGLRGLAALYVVMHHAFMQTTHSADRWNMSTPLVRSMKWLDYGHYAVSIFIVLSGYCLMLPVARSADGVVRGGFLGYIQRRAKRILPPYYAALILTLALLWFVPGLTFFANVHWDVTLPAFQPESIAAHALLIHNLKKGWIYNISHPLWSVATEWQIYFCFPVLVFLWRKLSSLALLLAAFGIGLIPYLYFGHAFELACPWFVGLFGLGMFGAVVGFSKQPTIEWLRTQLPWGTLSVLLTLYFGSMAFLGRNTQGVPLAEDWNVMWKLDTLIGAATVCLIVFCTRASIEREPKRWPLALKILDAKFPVWLGAFSYSLYLMHAPLIAWMHLHLRGTSLSETTIFWIMMGIGLPLITLASYLFYLAFERPFVTGAHKKKQPVRQSVPASPPAEATT